MFADISLVAIFLYSGHPEMDSFCCSGRPYICARMLRAKQATGGEVSGNSKTIQHIDKMAVPVEITRRAMMRPKPDCDDDAVGRMVPLTAFDRAATDGYVPAVFAWTAQAAPANAAVVDGLLATVARFPHLAGRLGVDDRGRRCFLLNNAGVLVLEADAAADLADALAHPDVSEHIDQLFPKADMVLYKCTYRTRKKTEFFPMKSFVV